MNRGWALGLCLIAAGGLALRCVRLDNRPMHNDEAVNALKVSKHWSAERYRYDPNEHHGPTLYYFSLLPVWLTGTADYGALRETTLRLTTAVFGVGLILLVGGLRRGLGMGATLVAALLTALSPAMVFYGRDYIHETLLVFFTLLMLVGGWRYFEGRGGGWAVVAGAGLGLMYATKETFVFTMAAMGAGLLATAWMEGGRKGMRRLWNGCKAGHLWAGALAALLVSQILFTSFFTNWNGPLDSLLAYLPWVKRAGGDSPHIHPWYFYLERIAFFQRPKGPVWTEGLVLLLAGVGMAAAFRGSWLRDTDRRLARFLTLYTLVLAIIYAAIAYKTPWCLLGFLHGFILLAGVGAVATFTLARPVWLRLALGGGLGAATAQLAWQSVQASFVQHSDWRNPYVYAQTVPDVLRLPPLVENVAGVHPEGKRMLIKVVCPEDDYWPLPYYLRSFEQVGWYRALPEDPYAPVVICAAKLGARLDDRSDRRWLMAGLFELRPRVFLELYVELELWKKWIASRPLPVERE